MSIKGTDTVCQYLAIIILIRIFTPDIGELSDDWTTEPVIMFSAKTFRQPVIIVNMSTNNIFI